VLLARAHHPTLRRLAVHALALTVAAGAGVAALRAATVQRASASDTRPSLQDIVRRSPALREDIGRSHEAVTTSIPRAQAFYDQGLAYLHSYVWLEAARSFTEALRADSDLAMAHLGLSYALGELGLGDEARASSRAAQRLAATVSDRERLRIQIRARQLEAADQRPGAAAQSAYAKALEDALAKFPSDVELLLLVGQAQDPPLASHGLDHESRSLPFYRKALDRSKDYFAVHHYLAHAYENMDRVDLALEHAERYAHDATGISHAHHMLGHMLRRLDRIEDAIAEFVRADEIEAAYLRREAIPAEYDWHYRHNLNLLGMAYQYVGRMNAAAIPLRRAFELDTAVPPADDLTRTEWPAFLLSQGRAGESLAAARTLVASSSPLLQALGHLLASRALQAQKRHEDAAAEGNLALQHMRAAGPLGGVLVPEFQLTQGEFLSRRGDTKGGRAMVRDGVEKLRAQSGPDAWAHALFSLEAAARTAREVRDWELASELADDMRMHDGSYAGTEYELGLVAEHKGDRPAAATHFRAAVGKWGNADPDLPALQDARRRWSAATQPR
jgi:tetratricopeptide (TPR) repeat protein